MTFWKNGQRPSGHWETVIGTSGRLIGRFRCSCCGGCRELDAATLARYKYCPNCGAKMDNAGEKMVSVLFPACSEEGAGRCICIQCENNLLGDGCCIVQRDCPTTACDCYEPKEAQT